MIKELSPENKNAIVFSVISLIAIFVSGLFFGFSYYVMDTIQTGFESVDCDLSSTGVYATCQEWFTATIYNLFNLKALIIPFSYFFIFALVGGMLVLGYKNGENPAMIGVIFVLTCILTYVGIEISNVYRTILANDTFYQIMLPFPIYNKIMLNFPWFTAFVGIASLVLSIVNFQRARVNTDASDLDY